ncbi:MAG: exonuclease domain-containing protein, partial [Firmicutes bacterium]|nr:exonuclease domain-containing protein [Bacillota bacterium]
MPDFPTRFVALDVETTGTDHETDRVIQVAAVLFDGARPLREFGKIVRPAMPIPLRVQRMTGITQEMADAAPSFSDVAQSLVEFVGDAPLVAHNSQFDVGFVGAELRRCGMKPLSNVVYDTLELARLVRPSSRSFRLERLAELEGVPLAGAHDAGADARAAGMLFLAYYRRLCRMNPSLIELISSLARTCGWGLADVLAGAAAKSAALYMSGDGVAYSEPPAALKLAVMGSAAGDIPTGVVAGDEGAGEIAPISPGFVEGVLGENGRLREALPDFEFRPQQLQMGYLVAEALSEGKHLLVEAGTGIGKSLAYLVPAAGFARLNHERLIVSTHTINLQEQLWEKDIPLVKDRLGIDFGTALLKGRANYACLRRWRALVARAPGMPPDEAKFVARLAVWLSETVTGDKSELGLLPEQEPLWDAIASDADSCEGQACPYGSSCYFQAARSAAGRADIIVVNHSLVLTDAVTGNRVLPEHSHVIFDEAHHLERSAGEHFGESVSSRHIERLLSFIARGLPRERLEKVLGEDTVKALDRARAAGNRAGVLLRSLAALPLVTGGIRTAASRARGIPSPARP